MHYERSLAGIDLAHPQMKRAGIPVGLPDHAEDHRIGATEVTEMADPTDKVEGSVSGKYYVDSDCIDCDVCRETAPDNF